MVTALGIIAFLIFVSVVSLIKFMRDMAVVEDRLLGELKEIKQWLIKINQKQL